MIDKLPPLFPNIKSENDSQKPRPKSQQVDDDNSEPKKVKNKFINFFKYLSKNYTEYIHMVY